MKYDIFISYSREDYIDDNKTIIPGNIVSKITDFLQANGFSYWFDVNGVYSGDSFTEIISEAIQDSEIFLFISTRASNSSKWTKHELAVAKHLGKKTIPFRVDDSKYNNSTLMYLAPLDYIDYRKNPNKAFDSLLAAINHHYDEKREKEELEKRKKEIEQEEIERAEALKQAERTRLARLADIDEEIKNLQIQINEYESKRSINLAKIDMLNEQISLQRIEINSLDATINEVNVSIKKLEKEKVSLSTSTTKKPNINEHAKDCIGNNNQKSSTIKSIFKFFNPISAFRYIKSLNFRYWFHLLLILLILIFLGCIPFNYHFRRDILLYLYPLFSIITICGLVQLLKGKKDGLVTLLLNSITFYLIWYCESCFSIFAYMGLTIYLFFVSILYLIHKSDDKTPLSWKKMTASKFSNPKRFLINTTIISVILSFAIPCAYAKSCGIESYDIDDFDDIFIFSLRGICGSSLAKWVGDEFTPDPKLNDTNKPNVYKALWWYELAQKNGSEVTERIAYCKQYIEGIEKGYIISDKYGRCGFNETASCFIKISIDSWEDVDSRLTSRGNKLPYRGTKVRNDLSYYISLINSDFSQGRLEIEGADSDSININVRKLYNIHGDSLKIRFIQRESIISERIIPVKKVLPEIELNSSDESLEARKEYEIIANNSIVGAEWRLLFEGNTKYIGVKEKSSRNIVFIIYRRPKETGLLNVEYIVNGKVVTSALYPIQGLYNSEDSEDPTVLL